MHGHEFCLRMRPFLLPQAASNVTIGRAKSEAILQKYFIYFNGLYPASSRSSPRNHICQWLENFFLLRLEWVWNRGTTLKENYCTCLKRFGNSLHWAPGKSHSERGKVGQVEGRGKNVAKRPWIRRSRRNQIFRGGLEKKLSLSELVLCGLMIPVCQGGLKIVIACQALTGLPRGKPDRGTVPFEMVSKYDKSWRSQTWNTSRYFMIYRGSLEYLLLKTGLLGHTGAIHTDQHLPPNLHWPPPNVNLIYLKLLLHDPTCHKVGAIPVISYSLSPSCMCPK